MIGLGSMRIGAGDGNGNSNSSSSSFSNLSALAPPFTVHRLVNPNPNSQYPEPPYWQYPVPSAPGSDLASVPLSDNYQFTPCPQTTTTTTTRWSGLGLGPVDQYSGDKFGYGGGVDPYYAPYVPPMVGEHSPLVVKDNEPPRYDAVSTTQTDSLRSLYDVDYRPQWADNLGFDYGKRAKRLEADGNLVSDKPVFGDSHTFGDGFKPGGNGIGFNYAYKQDKVFSYDVFSQASETETKTENVGNHGHMEDKSCLELNLSFLPRGSSEKPKMTSNAAYPESHSVVLPNDMPYSFSNYQHICSTPENIVGSTDSLFSCPVSVMRSSPAVVIRQPPTVSGTCGQNIVARTHAQSDGVIGPQLGHFDYSNFSVRKDLGKRSSSEIEGNSFDTELFHLPKQDNGQISKLSSPLKEVSSPRHVKNTSDRKVNVGFVSQLPSTTVSNCFDCVQVVTSTMGSSDSTDHHNFAVDSPCWKGAPYSLISSVDLEAGTSSHFEKSSFELHGFDHEVESAIDSMKTSSERACESNKNADYECAKNGIALTLGGFLDAVCPTGEETSSNAAKPGTRTSSVTSSLGIKASNEPNRTTKEPGFPNNLQSGFEMKISDFDYFFGEEDTGMALNDAAEGGVIAVDAAEKVLASPSSQEDPGESSKLLPNPKLDVPTVIRAMHNLSELLLFHISNDRCTLKEEYTETLKYIRSNLDSCVSKTTEPEQNNPLGNMSKKLWRSPSVSTNSGSPHKTDVTKGIQLDFCDTHPERRNGKFPNTKDEKSPIFSPPGHDLDITRDDDMTKAIKVVLDQNFISNDEMQPETLLFKNLWLQAEAKLCSTSYKARFDQMKIEMEKLKLKGPREVDDVVEMVSKACISPDPCTASKPVPKAHNVTTIKNGVDNSHLSQTSEHADDAEASVMERFNILKSREDNLKSVNVEVGESPDMVLESPSSILARFHILKSREEKLKSVNVEEEQTPEIVDSDSASSVMARFNIKSIKDNLKSKNVEGAKSPGAVDGDSSSSVMARFSILESREDSVKPINVEEEQQPEIGDDDFAGQKRLVPGISEEPEDEILKVALRPHFIHQPNGPSEGNFVSCIDGSVYEALDELNPSAPNYSMVHSIYNSRVVNQYYQGWRDISSSDWEHVLKDEVAWK